MRQIIYEAMRELAYVPVNVVEEKNMHATIVRLNRFLEGHGIYMC